MKTLRIFEREEPYRPIIIPIQHIKYVKRGIDNRFPTQDYSEPMNTILVVFLDGEIIDGFISADTQITSELESA